MKSWGLFLTLLNIWHECSDDANKFEIELIVYNEELLVQKNTLHTHTKERTEQKRKGKNLAAKFKIIAIRLDKSRRFLINIQ